jgi:hypothetical protein
LNFHRRRNCRLDLFGRRQCLNPLFNFGKGRRPCRGGNARGTWAATLGYPLLERIYLFRLQAAELVFHVVTKVTTVVQDGLGLQTKGLGQLENA